MRDLRAGPIEEQLVEGLLDVGIAFYPTEREDIDTSPCLKSACSWWRTRPPWRGARAPAVKDLAQVPLAMLPRAFATRRLVDDSHAPPGWCPGG